eukprot:TRINITY_DN26173_c0_g1_i1.p1 TRINITY_DN26173_c0_g1~~TRINITY_DN26173_c0_g1_i1.p1  ORF type:complete len:283 (-),score=52.28 TRINITY_DN26173_c0_g1_i1:576-1424(-)
MDGEDEDGRAVRRAVWRGAIPLRISLERDEVASLTAPPPFFVMGRRCGYLSHLLAGGPQGGLRAAFRSVLPLSGEESAWFEYKGLPLKWHIPLGALYDLLVLGPQDGSTAHQSPLPWHLTVHFRGYPSNVLPPLDGGDAMRLSFFSSLKEAAYALYGSTKLVMGQSQAEQAELWRCVEKGDEAGYEAASAGLRPGVTAKRRGSAVPPAEAGLPSSGARHTRIPLRIYVRSCGDESEGSGEEAPQRWEDVGILTRCVDGGRGGPATDSSGALTKLTLTGGLLG